MAAEVKKAKDTLSIDMVIKGETASETLNTMGGDVVKLQKKIADLGPTIVKAFAVLTVAATAMYVKLADDTARLAQQLGAISGGGAAFLEGYQQSFGQFGILAHSAMEDLKAFARVGFKGSAEELQNAAAQMHIFSEMTGLSKEEVADYTSELSKFGSEAIGIAEETMSSFVHLQKQFKFSAKEASALFEATQSAALALFSYARGDVTKGITEAVKEVQKFGAMLTKTGVSAKTTTSILESLTDPKKWMDNAFLMTRMGYSIGDMQKALTNPNFMPKASKMYGQLVDVAKDYYERSKGNVYMQDMYAEALGITRDELKKLGTQTADQTERMMLQLDAQQSLAEAWAGFGSGISKLKRAMGIFSTTIGMSLMPVIKIVSKFAEALGEVAQNFADWAQKSKWAKAFLLGFLVTVTILAVGVGVYAAAATGAAAATLAFLSPIAAASAAILGVSAFIGVLVAGLVALEKKTGILGKSWDWFAHTILPPLQGGLAVIGDLFKLLWVIVKPIVKVLAVVAGAFVAIGAAIAILMNPITWIVAGVMGFLIILDTLVNKFDVVVFAVKTITKSLVDFHVKGIMFIWEGLKLVGGLIADITKSFISFYADGIMLIWDGLKKLGSFIIEFSGLVFNTFKKVGSFILQPFINVISSIKSMFTGLIQGVIEKFKSIGPAIKANILTALASIPMAGKFFKKAAAEAQAEVAESKETAPVETFTTPVQSRDQYLSNMGANEQQLTQAQQVAATNMLNENINNNTVNVERDAEMASNIAKMTEALVDSTIATKRGMSKIGNMSPTLQFGTMGM